MKVFGTNLEILEQLAEQIRQEMSQVQGMEDVGTFHVVGQPNLNITVDREKAARYGLNTGDVNTVIQAAIGGANATTVLEGDRRSWPSPFPSRPSSDRHPCGRRCRDRRRPERQRICAAARTRRYQVGYGRILHLPRSHPALHPDQVQRSRPRSRQHGRRSPGAHQGNIHLPNGYHILGRRVR